MFPNIVIIVHLCVTGIAAPVDCRDVNPAIYACGGSSAYDRNSGEFDSCIIETGGRTEITPSGVTIFRGK